MRPACYALAILTTLAVAAAPTGSLRAQQGDPLSLTMPPAAESAAPSGQAAANTAEPLRLGPRREPSLPRLPGKEERPAASPGFGPSTTAVAGSLAVALGVFLLLAWAVRRHLPKSSGKLPAEVIEVLGQTTLTAKQQLHLLRVGSKLLLVSVTPGGVETLTEIADAQEVDRLLGLCQSTRRGSSAAAFSEIIDQFTRGEGFDEEPRSQRRASLFAFQREADHD